MNEKRLHIRMVIWLISFIFLLVQPSLSIISPAVEADPDTIYVKDDYLTIQEAIDNADEGDTIIVESGTYKESIEIDKRLNIQGQNKATTFIDGMGEDFVVWIESSAENTTFSGFTIHNASNTGILPWRGAKISDCIVHDCEGFGIYATLLSSARNPRAQITIKNCVCYGNGLDGINIKESGNATVENCVCYGNDGDGIEISESRNVRIENCVTYNNNRGIGLYHISNATIIGCEAYSNVDDGIHLDYTDHSSIMDCDAYNNSDEGIALGDSNYVQFKDCDSYNNSDIGIYLWYSYSSQIENCNCYENDGDGMYLWYSDNAFLKNCDSYDNKDDGITINTLENSRLVDCDFYDNADGGIIIIHSDYILVQGCEIYNHNTGIYMEYSHSNSICSSTFHNNNYGMYIKWTNFLYASKSAFHENTYDGIYAEYSNSTIIFCNITDNGDDGITAYISDMMVKYCNIENNGDDGLYDTGTCRVDATECWWGNETGPYNWISNPSGTGDPCEPLDFEPWMTEPVAGAFPLISDLRCHMLRAEADSVYYVPTGNIYDDSTFYAFYAYKDSPQIVTPPTQSSASDAYLDVDGSPLFDGDIVTFGGRFANRLVAYYEDAGLAKIGFANNGTHRIFRRISDGAHIYAVDSSTYNESEKDYFVFQVYGDGDRYILSEWGIRAPGTYAGGTCFIDVIVPNVGTFMNSYYVFSWTDVNGDGKPQRVEIAVEASGN